MFSSFLKHGQDKSAGGKERVQEDHERPHSPANSHEQRASEQQPQFPPTLRPSLERVVTTAVSTPHDAVLAELFPHRRGVDWTEAVPETHEGSSLKDGAETSHRPRSPSRTPLHDPFAGSLIGLSIHDDGDHTHGDRMHFETRKEDLWSHMINIREIQTQIANMHVAMENIGLGHQADQLPVERMHSTAASEGEKWEDAVEGEDDEVKEKEAREQEFTKLANKFRGRKEATENIMTKLDELSRVVTAFHALRTPVVDFEGSRSKAKNLVAGESATQTLDPPLIIVPPPREQQREQETFLQTPVPVRVGNVDE